MQVYSEASLSALIMQIRSLSPKRLINAIKRANREGNLKLLLDLLGLDTSYLPLESVSEAAHGKIIIVGRQNVKEVDIHGIAKCLGISKSRIDFIEFEQVKRYPFHYLEYSSKVGAVLFGAVPHSAVGMDDYSSIISSLEEKHRLGIVHARIMRLKSGKVLKLTKSNIRDALSSLLTQGFLVADIELQSNMIINDRNPSFA